MALQMQQGLALHVAHALALDLEKRIAAGEKSRHIVEFAANVDGRQFIPPPAIRFMPRIHFRAS
jgi:hypothetical protein